MARVLPICLLLVACAPMVEADCRAGNWYALGERDAMAGLPPRIDQYTEQCGRLAVRPSEADYLAGWNAGTGERDRRMSGSRM